ncbi:MAG: TonB-dependent receptor [Phocaeicola vulgatus]|nr:MAG: TonB-dependent receptor [Phocaeicola vulgatus]
MNTASYPDYLRGDVKPITNRTWEIGTGIHFLQGHRLKLDVSYFNKLTYNNTISQRISSATGYKSRLMNIDEEYVRRGVEISIDATRCKSVISHGMCR